MATLILFPLYLLLHLSSSLSLNFFSLFFLCTLFSISLLLLLTSLFPNIPYFLSLILLLFLPPFSFPASLKIPASPPPSFFPPVFLPTYCSSMAAAAALCSISCLFTPSILLDAKVQIRIRSTRTD